MTEVGSTRRSHDSSDSEDEQMSSSARFIVDVPPRRITEMMLGSACAVLPPPRIAPAVLPPRAVVHAEGPSGASPAVLRRSRISDISNDALLISVENYVEDERVKPQIQRIPSLLRDKESNKSCYDPLVVSIGPYHKKKSWIDSFEKLKIPIAQEFLHACEKKVSIEQIYEAVAREGNSALECYEEGSTNESFNKIMFLDACFVLHFMSSILETESNYSNGTAMKQKVNPLGPLLPWSSYFNFVCRDLFLLENQIPLQVLKVLMKFRFRNEREGTMLIPNFLDRIATIMPPQERTRTNAVKKVVQRMMGCRCSVQKKEESNINMDACHLLHLVREQLIGSSPKDKNNLVREQPIGSSPEDKNKKKWCNFRHCPYCGANIFCCFSALKPRTQDFLNQ
ncbi:unnamed protein product [Fraxinus pennsylvanica]|uniref:Uncharacterized protein n=1 Tax=Fraxinus pennsylvanica TaxID=56036 RepID=A0AAD2A1H3_9LAMI|nr:unnamed protein product [Fraxinus pennsylvanica]